MFPRLALVPVAILRDQPEEDVGGLLQPAFGGQGDAIVELGLQIVRIGRCASRGGAQGLRIGVGGEGELRLDAGDVRVLRRFRRKAVDQLLRLLGLAGGEEALGHAGGGFHDLAVGLQDLRIKLRRAADSFIDLADLDGTVTRPRREYGDADQEQD